MTIDFTEYRACVVAEENALCLDAYIDLGADMACLDGWFNSSQLRNIAAAMDRLAVKKHKANVDLAGARQGVL